MLKKEQYSRLDAAWMHFVTKVFKKQDGTSAEFYRPQTGQRLYFSDISIDVVHAQEQLILEEATADINDCSTWFMLNIEGQKVLLTGDGENGCQKTIMANYNRDYLDLDMMTLMHHGFNTHDYFTDYCYGSTSIKQILTSVNCSIYTHDLFIWFFINRFCCNGNL